MVYDGAKHHQRGYGLVYYSTVGTRENLELLRHFVTRRNWRLVRRPNSTSLLDTKKQ